MIAGKLTFLITQEWVPEGDQRERHLCPKPYARQSPKTGLAVYLLEALALKQYTYVGKVQLAHTPYTEQQIDNAGNMCAVWMFPVRVMASSNIPEDTEDHAREIERVHRCIAQMLATEVLKQLAMRANIRRLQGALQYRLTTGIQRLPSQDALREPVKRLAKASGPWHQTRNLTA